MSDEKFEAYTGLVVKAGNLDKVVGEVSTKTGCLGYKVFGLYDVIVKVKGADFDEVAKMVLKLTTINEVISCTTYPVVECIVSDTTSEKPFAFTFMGLIPQVIDVFRKEVRGIEGLSEIKLVLGPFDAIAVINASSLNQLDEINEALQRVEGVSRTVTHIRKGK